MHFISFLLLSQYMRQNPLRTVEPYFVIRGEVFETPEEAWKTIAGEIPFCKTIEEKEWANGRTLQDTFGSASFQQKIGALAIGQRQQDIVLSQKKIL
jgi:hypothetical protein